ncbi:MAG: hypothetical protein A2X67_06630 [Ignavibacteria bacterium GWA2_55_11]|nr:MAG: hypothetical protein A2X67_06630 [Ignavibacteria bacterium GWA2_55_11]OGU47363.1 MAG: hypothetical protein A2X68_03940 [Ignavibacteria bacterium GWC2_56_12]OGU74031.1 MAG: hypothetical protein A3H45_15405 [Ignavibacteria bacterium RIFCSPLOWO2_02_FULL_55_14]OGU75548.1 MAG: hypothetical protein A3G43_14350 [Ignavibacteria bacterium RIFCSPLOWO2_12_FULL_56_21]HAV24173.1 hypothetical protein [Bacteroidota bacterium]
MAKSKYIMHDCAYCHKQTKMELVGGMTVEGHENDPQKMWYRCTRCKHSALLSDVSTAKEKRSSLPAIDRASCVEYAAEKIYTIGQEIYHAGLDDVGRVIRKDKTSGGIHSIIVSFVNAGERKLLENMHLSQLEDQTAPRAAGL